MKRQHCADLLVSMRIRCKIGYKATIVGLWMLRPGFEPESSARKAEMIGRTTLPEHIYLLYDFSGATAKPRRPLYDGPICYIYISDAPISFGNSPGRIRTAVAGSKGPQD